MKHCAASGKRGFTLIELLVVIAIIAILAAILFPVFAQAREKARQSTCTSNLKQIGNALEMYAQDYDGFFPKPAYNASGTAGIDRSWEDLIAIYVGAKGKYDASANPRYSHTVFDCPSLAPSPSQVERTIGDYGLCQLFMPLPEEDRRYLIDTRSIKNPSVAGAVTEARDCFACTAAKIGVVGEDWKNRRFLRNPHAEGLNILYCDGHVKWKKAVIGDDLEAIFRYDAE